jgi:hypothetical protein
MTDTGKREIGSTGSPIEDELEHAFNAMVTEGVQRLHRTWREVLVTGFFGGTEVAMGSSPSWRCCTRPGTSCSSSGPGRC